MERMARPVRQSRMMDQRPGRGRAGLFGLLGILGTGLLFAAVSGCGSVVASAPGAAAATTTASPTTTAAAAAAGATALPTTTASATASAQVGCASVNQATSVLIRRTMHLMVPVGGKPLLSTTYRQTAQLRALFGQICAAVTHPAPTLLMHCPADFGTEYLGTFYDGSRVLATFSYAATGCARVSLTAGSKTLATMVYGRAAAAAPHLAADLDVIVGAPKPGEMQPQGGVNPGGVNKPA
jgi:hypothetical protein